MPQTASFYDQGSHIPSSYLESHDRQGDDDDVDPLFGSSQTADAGSQADSQDGLYAILNLARDCTDEQIQRSFKRLAALLHPDRHLDPTLKSSADSRFQALQRAYEVLSDPHKRAIYDELGEAGLSSSAANGDPSRREGWDVGQKTKTPAELRADFERERGRVREAKVEGLVKSKGELTCTTDARVLFLSDEERERLGGPARMTLAAKLGTITTKQMFLKHSFTTPITESTSVMFTSQLLSRQGQGGGNMIIKLLTRPTSTTSIEIGTTVLRPRALTFKGTYAPDNDSFATFEFPVRNLAHPPPFTLTIGRRVTERVTATFSVRSGIYSLFSWGSSSLEPITSSSTTLSLIHHDGYSLTTSFGLLSSSLSGDWSTVALGGVKIRVGGTIDTGGNIGSHITGERRVTELSKLSMGLQVDVGGAMTVKLSWSRLGQKITLPIIVSSNLQPTLVVAFTVLPTLSVTALNHLYIYPQKRKRLSGRISEMREEHKEFIAEKKKEAEEAVELLRENSRKKVESETKLNGLVILQATYGASSPDEQADRTFDVTIPLQSLVSDSQLTIVGGRSKASLLGFYDCAMGEKKVLKVKYSFKSREHFVEVGDRDGLAAPVRAHLVQ